MLAQILSFTSILASGSWLVPFKFNSSRKYTNYYLSFCINNALQAVLLLIFFNVNKSVMKFDLLGFISGVLNSYSIFLLLKSGRKCFKARYIFLTCFSAWLGITINYCLSPSSYNLYLVLPALLMITAATFIICSKDNFSPTYETLQFAVTIPIQYAMLSYSFGLCCSYNEILISYFCYVFSAFITGILISLNYSNKIYSLNFEDFLEDSLGINIYFLGLISSFALGKIVGPAISFGIGKAQALVLCCWDHILEEKAASFKEILCYIVYLTSTIILSFAIC